MIKTHYFIHSVRQLTHESFEVLLGKKNSSILLCCVISIQELLTLQSVETLVSLYYVNRY